MTGGRMPSPRPPQAYLLLVCFCASAQRVARSSILCGLSWCSGDRCCDGHCCDPMAAEWSHWLGLAFILSVALFGGACLFTMCRCYKNCAALHPQEEGESAQRPATPAPWTGPPGPLESPPQQPDEDPPPYSEVVSKPFPYPLPALPPPCYSQVVGAEPPSTGVSPQTTL